MDKFFNYYKTKTNKNTKINKYRKKNSGITLIALVVTIVILLILASISIGALTGDKGIIDQAHTAKEDTEIASWEEQIDLAIIDAEKKNRNPSLDDIKEELKNKGIIDDYSQVDDKTGAITTNEPVATIEGKLDDYLSKITEGLEIGSTVSYNPDGTYDKFNENYSGSTNNPDKLDSSTKEFNIDTWRVFDINEHTGEVTLVPEFPTDWNDGYVYLSGAQGYNNGVYLLNEACSKLYGNDSKGIKARSINITDIEGKMTNEALQEAHNYSNAVKYENQVSNGYIKDNSYYPSIYAQEKLNGVNGTQSSSGLGTSEQTKLIEPTDNGAKDGYLQAESIRPTQTYWRENNGSFKKEDFVTSENGTSYYDLLIAPPYELVDFSYWLASRSVDCYEGSTSDYCLFYINNISGLMMSAGEYLFTSNSSLEEKEGIFPIVSLNSKLISGNPTDGFFVDIKD